jgi:parvulin-like peptidyl-prolyl isomerase
VAPIRAGIRVLAIALLAVVMGSACGRTFRPPAAVVHGSAITDDELQRNIPRFEFLTSLSEQPCGQPRRGETQDAACSRFVLGQLIEQDIIVAYARAHHLSVSRAEIRDQIRPLARGLGGRREVLKRLAQHGLTIRDLRTRTSRLILVRTVEQSVAASRVRPRDLHRLYRRDRLQFTLIHVAHILVSSRAQAQRIANVATPQNFAQLARRYSADRGSDFRGGDLGTNRASDLDPTFARAALTLVPGQISGPVHTSLGWHVIYLMSEARIPFIQVRSELVSEAAGGVFIRWLHRQAGTGIDVNPRFGTFDPVSGRVLGITCTADVPASC